MTHMITIPSLSLTHIHHHNNHNHFTAALRTAYELASGQALPQLQFDDIRGLQGVKRATVAIPSSPDGKGGPAKVHIWLQSLVGKG